MKLYFIKYFIKHYLTATFIDVLHSPFIFNLYQTAIKRQKEGFKFDEIESCRLELKNNNQLIHFEDLGAGSNLLSKSKIKKVKDIALTHLKFKRISQIIYYLVLNYKHKNIIELGTSLGISTSYISLALKSNFNSNDVNFTTIEGVPDVREIANLQFNKLKLADYIHSVEGNFDLKLAEVLKKYETLDLFFVDGNHTYEATIKYFNTALPYAHNNSLFIFDDIYWSKGMTKAWDEIKENPKVFQTVDLFYIGLVFFRSEQNKQHFKLRVI